MARLVLRNGMLVLLKDYDKSIYYAAGLSSGSNITLPNSETYIEDGATDMIVIFNDRVVECVRDFDTPEGATKTYITTIYDLPVDSVVRFMKK